MKPFPEGQMYGTYKRDVVMVVGVPDDISNGDGEAVIYYHSPSHKNYGLRMSVKWRDVQDIHGAAVERR